MLLLFFFFKQKTAYEMRISDWSSDVCSSDLVMMMAVAAGLAFEAETIRRRLMYTGLVGLMFLPFLYTLSRASYVAAIPALLAQIGRASCRERVCQYV